MTPTRPRARKKSASNWGFGEVRTVIDSDGNVIEGAAELMTEIRPEPEGPVHARVFRCPNCGGMIYADVDEITKHECAAP